MRNRMFVGTSFSEAFWEDFGMVLGGQKPQFSHFFRHFFEANFKGIFGRPKNRKKMTNKRADTEISAPPGGMCMARGRDREGVRRDLGLDF